MKKILLAINNQKAEEIYISKLKEVSEEHKVTSRLITKESVSEVLEDEHFDILMFIEGLTGEGDDFDFVINLKRKYPKLRIIFIAADRKYGDNKLAALVSYQIFDILLGKILMKDMIDKTINPTSWEEASKYLPKSSEVQIFKEEEFEERKDDEIEDNENISEEIIGELEFGVSLKDKLKDKIDVVKKDKPLISTNINPEENLELMQIKKELEKSKKREEQIKKEKLKLEKETKKVLDENRELYSNYNTLKTEYEELDKSRNSLSKQKVITFYGATPGVGNSTNALNTAFYLSMKGHKTIYIEFNDILPTLSYWFDFEDFEFGLEKSFFAIETRNYKDVSKSILTKNKILKLNSEQIDKHKKFSDHLSFMFFTNKHIKKGEHGKVNPNTLKDLLLFLLYKEGYDYVILDLYAHTNFDIIETATTFSSLNIFSITQDISSVGASLEKFFDLKSSGVEFEHLSEIGNNFKNIYLVNKYSKKAYLDKKSLKNWLESDKILYVPENNPDVINALFKSLPPVLFSKNKEYLLAIKNIAKIIE